MQGEGRGGAGNTLVPYSLILEHFQIERLKGLKALQGVCLTETGTSVPQKSGAKVFLASLFIVVPTWKGTE